MGSKILRAQSALMLLMNSRKIAKRNLKCVEVYLELHIFFMLAREFESVETSPGLASPYLVSFFLKLVQCKSRLNCEIQPSVVEGIHFTHT